MNDQNCRNSKISETTKNTDTGLIRVDEELKDKVRLQAFKNKVSMKEYVEYLILKDENEISNCENSKDSKKEVTDQDLEFKTIKIEIEARIYIN